MRASAPADRAAPDRAAERTADTSEPRQERASAADDASPQQAKDAPRPAEDSEAPDENEVAALLAAPAQMVLDDSHAVAATAQAPQESTEPGSQHTSAAQGSGEAGIDDATLEQARSNASQVVVPPIGDSSADVVPAATPAAPHASAGRATQAAPAVDSGGSANSSDAADGAEPWSGFVESDAPPDGDAQGSDGQEAGPALDGPQLPDAASTSARAEASARPFEAVLQRAAGVEARPASPGLTYVDPQRAAQILDQVRVALRPGLREATIELSPAELGRVTIRLHVDEDGMRGELRAERPEALAALERHTPELRAALAEHGIDVGEFELTLGFAPKDQGDSGGSAGASSRDASRPKAHAEHDSVSQALQGALAGAAARSGIDTYA